MNIEDIYALVADHKYAALAALVIGFVVRLLKDDTKIPINVPSRYRLPLAFVLGLTTVVLEKVAAGVAWKQAILDGVMGWFFADTGHRLVIDSLRGGKEFAVPGLMIPGASPSPGKPPSIPPKSNGKPPTLPPMAVFMLSFMLLVLPGCAWLKANGPELALSAGQMSCLIISQDLPDTDVAKVCEIAQPLWGPMKDVLAILRGDSAKRMASASARQEMKDRQEQAIERLKELKSRPANDNHCEQPKVGASLFTVYQGKKYRAKIHLSWAESFAADSTILRTAQAKLQEAGFSNVKAWKSGDDFLVEGVWSSATTSAPLDDHLRDVREVQ